MKKNNIINLNKHAYIFYVDETYDIKTIFEEIKNVVKNELNLEQAEKICSLIDVESFADLKIIRPEGKTIKKEQLLDLMSDFKNSSYYNWRKIYIVEYAENLNPASANTILKFLEEPENDIIAILITKNISNVLSTIVSRCEIINLNKYALSKYDINLVEKTFEYINLIEKHKENAIAYMDELYSIKGDELAEIIKIMILLYEDILSYCTTNKILNFKELSDKIIQISKICEINDIIKKENYLKKIILLLDSNVNSRVLLDSFFIGGYYE